MDSQQADALIKAIEDIVSQLRRIDQELRTIATRLNK